MAMRKVFDNDDKALEKELNLYATAYLIFKDDNETNLNHCMMNKGLFQMAAEEVHEKVIEFLSEVSATYAGDEAFITDIKAECEELVPYAEELISREKKLIKRLYKLAASEDPTIEERGDLETRWSDSEDFLEVPVWAIREMLKKAYKAGYEDGKLFKTKKYLQLIKNALCEET